MRRTSFLLSLFVLLTLCTACTYPMMVVMPGYDMMWFGEESSGSNLSWRGLLAWTELDEDLIVVSAQLTMPANWICTGGIKGLTGKVCKAGFLLF